MAHRMLVFIALVHAVALQAQKEYNIWHFGLGASLDFNTSPPTPLVGSKVLTWETSTSMCDSSGNLLFYTNGDSIYNRNHQLMQNSHTGAHMGSVNSCVQGTLAVPVPGMEHQYYLFHGVATENITKSKDSMLKYSLIDMQGDGGLGRVVFKDRPLFEARRENFSLTMHANGIDYWVMAADEVSGNINYTRTINGQFTSPVMRFKRTGNSTGFCNLKFSPDSRFVYAPITLNSQSYSINLYKFDNATGRLYDMVSLPLGNAYGGGLMEFSPNSRFFYVIFLEGLDYVLYQYDLAIWNAADMTSSRQKIATYHYLAPGFAPISGFQLGPDKKIYCFHNNYHTTVNVRLSVIHNPDKKGQACNFVLRKQDIYPGLNNNGGPHYPIYKFRNSKIDIGPDTIICKEDSLRLICFASTYDKIQWSTGDTGVFIWVKKEGKYSVRVKSPNGLVQYDTMELKVGPKHKVFIGNDTAFCGKFTHILKPKGTYTTYSWNTGEATMQIEVNEKGVYSLMVLDSNACASADTTRIDQIARPVIRLFHDSVNCIYTYLSVDTMLNLRYKWNTGDTGQTIMVTQKGSYSVTASHAFCSNIDSIVVDRLARPEPRLGPDTFMCRNHIHIGTIESGDYIWNTGATKDSIIVEAAGEYWLRVSRNNCSATDTIRIAQLRLPVVNLGPDVSLCQGKLWLGTSESGQYLWSTLETTDSIEVFSPGKYWLTITESNCATTDTVLVKQSDQPSVDLGPDFKLCSSTVILRTQGAARYLWSTGESSPSILVQKPGLYWVMASNASCQAIDSIFLSACEPLTPFIPNSFSPNGDNHNDIFMVHGSGIAFIEMEIYNRWGEKLLVTSGVDAQWDGTYMDSLCQEGIYLYKVTIRGNMAGDFKYLYGKVILLR